MTIKQIKLSVIIPTLGRTEELTSLFSTIHAYKQEFDVEIILVDQNFGPVLIPIVKEFENVLSIYHYNVDFRGASRARNFGIQHATGDIFCFPDDDCKFLPETIKLALAVFENINCDVVFGKCIDDSGNDSVIKWSKSAGYLSMKNCGDKFVEATMFARRKIFENLLYDETLGVGTFHGSAEAYDLVIRLLTKNKVLYYSPDIVFNHPNKVVDHSLDSSIRRTFSYSCGFGKLCLKHGLYKIFFHRLLLVTGFIPLSLFIARNKTRYYCAELLGLLSGVTIK